MFQEIATAVNVIKNTGSTNDKKALLKKYGQIKGFKETLQFIYNPLVKTNIAATKLDNAAESYKMSHPYTPGPMEVFEAINYFTKHQTGTAYDVFFAWRFIESQTTREAQELARALVTQDLKIGVSTKTLNTVYGPGFIPVIECMLGVEYSKIRDKMKGTYISSRKIDGVRRLLIKENGKVSMFSRNGLPDEGLIDIEREAMMFLPDNTVYDGELEAMGNFSNNLELRQATNSLANRKGIRTALTFNIFDIIPLDEFKAGCSKNIALVRKMALEAMFGLRIVPDYEPLPKMNYIKVVPVECVSNVIEEHEKVFRNMVINGQEGIMLIQANSFYEPGKRSNNWVKMKQFFSDEYKVIDTFEGDGKFAGMLGGVVIDYKGHFVGVGSGFNDNERRQYWATPWEIVGKTIEVMHQGESTNQSGGISLNCPIFKGVRYDK